MANNYDVMGLESSNGSGISVNDQNGTVTVKLNGKTILTLSGGSCQINPPLAMIYVDGLTGKIKEIEDRLSALERRCSSIEQTLNNHESRINSLESRW